MGCVTPSKIQKNAFPYVLNGVDVIVQSKNGTGKTVIFSVTAVQKIDLSIAQVQSIVIVPTREIAIQVHSVIEKISKHVTDPNKVTSRSFIGGTKWDDDFAALEKGTHILICSVGRLKKLLEKDKIPCEHLKLVVLDEADKLFSFQLKNQIEAVLNNLMRKTSEGRKVQVLAFSATFPRSQRREVEKYMNNPEFLSLVGVRNLEVDNVLEFYISLPQVSKLENVNRNQQQVQPVVVRNYQTKKRKLLEVLNRLDPHLHQVIIFTSTTSSCENLSSCLQKNHYMSSHLTSRLSQEERSRVIGEFRSFKIRILVTTQLLSRGVDFCRVNVVINFEIPEDSNEYIHIMGRAGRFGRVGLFLNFVVSEDEFRRLMYARRLCSEEKPIRTFPDSVHPSLYVPQFTTPEDEGKLKEFVRRRRDDEKSREVVLNDANFLVSSRKKRRGNHNNNNNNRRQGRKRKFQQNDSTIQEIVPPPLSTQGNNSGGKKRRRRRRKKKKKKSQKKKKRKRKPRQKKDEDTSSATTKDDNSQQDIIPPPPPPPPSENKNQAETREAREGRTRDGLTKAEEESVVETVERIGGHETKSGEDVPETSFKDLLSSNFGIFSSFMEDMK